MKRRSYPTIFEIALKAGRWSLAAGAGAAILGAAGCGSDSAGRDGIENVDVAQQDSGQDLWLAGDDVRGYDFGPVDVPTVGRDSSDFETDSGDTTTQDFPVIDAGMTGDEWFDEGHMDILPGNDVGSPFDSDDSDMDAASADSFDSDSAEVAIDDVASDRGISDTVESDDDNAS